MMHAGFITIDDEDMWHGVTPVMLNCDSFDDTRHVPIMFECGGDLRRKLDLTELSFLSTIFLPLSHSYVYGVLLNLCSRPGRIAHERILIQNCLHVLRSILILLWLLFSD